MDKGQTPDHMAWRIAIADLVRKIETLVGIITERAHHRYLAHRVKRLILRTKRGKASVLSGA